MQTLISFLAVLVVLVFVHELGHFITAKRAGVKVLEFGFFYPPRLFAIKRGDTEYSINLLPLGGFVKMVGEEDPSDPESLAAKGAGTRILVMSAGALMNLFLALALFTVGFMAPRTETRGDVVVQDVVAGSPAAEAGMRTGDLIAAIGGYPIQSITDARQQIYSRLGQETQFTVRRNGDELSLTALPRLHPPAGEGALGSRLAYQNPQPVTVAYPLWEAAWMSVQQSLYIVDLTRTAVVNMFFSGDFSQLAGPVGIAQATGEVASSGWLPLLEWTAVLSLNLAIINILPLPMLDGGRIFFVLIEIVRRGKRIPPEREALVHAIGFALLLTLMLLISFNDIMRWLGGGTLLQ